ncbi:MAG TPA: hypothetical protein VK749_19235 [Xanthobacteraceae bacterium]|nr:hypothetical protein [Xanthobacteraceae bacterium]
MLGGRAFPGYRHGNPLRQSPIADHYSAQPDTRRLAGFRVEVIFQPGPIVHRLNLVEGDTSFAFFVEADASLMGTVFDGTAWYQVKSAPGTIVPGRLYRAMFEYTPSSSLLLFLNDGLLTLQGSNGAAIRPVQQNGIKVGYWPGGDSRYTYSGLMGPMAIHTLDPYADAVNGIGKFVCSDIGPQQDFFNILGDAAKKLTPTEAANTDAFFKTLVDCVWKTLGALVATATDPRQMAVTLSKLSAQLDALLVRDQRQGTSFFADPEFFTILQGAIALLDAAPLAKDVFFAQITRAVSALPISQSRAQEIFAACPNLTTCMGEIGQALGGSGNPVTGWVGGYFPGGGAAGWQPPCDCSGGSGSGGAGTSGSGMGGTTGGSGAHGTGSGGGSGKGNAGSGTSSAEPCTGSTHVHVHVHCCSDDKKE